MNIGDIELKWLGHSGFLIAPASKNAPSDTLTDTNEGKNSTPSGVPSIGGKIIYIDPYQIKEDSEKADLILITHSHYDHCSVADLNRIVKEGTKIVITADCQSKITRFNVPIKIEIIEPGQEIVFGGVKISAIPAYNTDKSFHPKEENWIGYLIKTEGVIIYYAGDTDVIPEMEKLTGYKQQGKQFVALLPVGGRFTMTPEEAAEAANIIKPDIAIPMHWGSVVGTEDDAKEFCELCKEEGIKCVILEKS